MSFDLTHEYLLSIGKLDCANKDYKITVQLENKNAISITLKGNCTSEDIIIDLKKRGYLHSNDKYFVTNWPSVIFRHESKVVLMDACVCEVNTNKIYFINDTGSVYISPAVLYGCPNLESIDNGAILDQSEIEVIDYDDTEE